MRVRLIDAGTGEQLESGLFDRPWGDLFALQREIADSVSRFLRERLGREIRLREQRAATRNVAAWELVRRAEEWTEDADALERAGDLEASSRLLGQADSLLAQAERMDSKWSDPILARGWLTRTQAGLADDRGIRAETGRERTAVSWLRAGLAHAERALRVRPHDPRALELQGAVHFSLWRAHRGDSAQAAGLLAAAERDLRTAVATNPGLARAWNTLSLVYHQRGDWAQADRTLRRALEADAYLSETAPSMEVLMFASLELGDSAAARSWCETGRTQFPSDYRFWGCELTILGWRGTSAGDAARAWVLLRRVEQRDSGNLLATGWAVRRLMVAAVLARAGLADSARNVLRTTRAGVPSAALLPRLGLYEAFVHTELGERDEALSRLGEFLGTYPQQRSYVANTRWFAPLRGDPRFTTLVGLPADSAVQRGGRR
ncbi:MAG: hypothetical protein HY334_03550 [Armatimonadetes bacterium]|nr:hypothetical protein [Armatimonadota bacterium]